jgi:hypothetical protein
MSNERLAEIKHMANRYSRVIWDCTEASFSSAVSELIAEVGRLREHVASLEHAYKDSRERIRELESGVMF